MAANTMALNMTRLGCGPVHLAQAKASRVKLAAPRSDSASVRVGADLATKEGANQPRALISSFLSTRKAAARAGVYVIQDQNGVEQYVGYARDIGTAVQGHLASLGPAACHYLQWRPAPSKGVATRQQLQAEQQSWLRELGHTPPGNDGQAHLWQARVTASDRSTNAASSPSEGHRIVEPQTGEQGAREGGALTIEAVNESLDRVRPYLHADGGDVEVVAVADGIVSLRFQGACGTCSSSATTMRETLERALQNSFGEDFRGVQQLDSAASPEALSLSMVDKHLDQLRPAIQSFGGSVKVIDIADGLCVLDYAGPPQIKTGVHAAIKDKFPTIQDVVFR